MGKKLLLETTAPFQGLPELVAYNEGLFAKEGLDVEFIERGQAAPRNTNTGVTNIEGVSPFLSHASSFEGGNAAMYNACEWGNYRRVQDSNVQFRHRRPCSFRYGFSLVGPALSWIRKTRHPMGGASASTLPLPYQGTPGCRPGNFCYEPTSKYNYGKRRGERGSDRPHSHYPNIFVPSRRVEQLLTRPRRGFIVRGIPTKLKPAVPSQAAM